MSQATLIDPKTGQKRVVTSGSPEASQLMGQGFQLMTGANAPAPTPPKAVAPNTPQTSNAFLETGKGPQPFQYPDMGVFGTAMNEMRSKLTKNNDLLTQKATILKQLYDRPLSDEELKVLSPSQASAVRSGNRALIDMEVRLINDQVQGRNNTLDQGINYITNLYSKEKDDQQTKFKDAQQTVLSFIQQYGSNAEAALTSLYGPGKLAELKAMGIDIASLAHLPTVAESKISAQYGTGAGSFTIDIPGGSLADRNNNPGNLRYVGQEGATLGAGGFAKFATAEDGYNALVSQIQLDGSRGLTVTQFINKYAPPSENNTSQYIQQFTQALGISQNTKISDLSAQDVADFMIKKESGASRQQTESDVQLQADAITRGDQPPPNPATGRSSVATQKLFAELSRRGFNVGSAYSQWVAQQKVISSMNSTQMIRFRGLATSVVNTIDEVKSLADQMKQSGLTALNKASLTVLVNTQGNTTKGQLASRYLAAVNTLKEEFANLAQGGYAPTEAAWGLANGQINANYGVDQLNASIAEIQRLINYRVNALEGVTPVTPGQQSTLPSSGDDLRRILGY